MKGNAYEQCKIKLILIEGASCIEKLTAVAWRKRPAHRNRGRERERERERERGHGHKHGNIHTYTRTQTDKGPLTETHTLTQMRAKTQGYRSISS